MDFWVILLAACLASALVVTAVLLWVGVNAILHGRGLTREAALTIATLRQALRSIYEDTVRESLPDDFVALLRKLTRRKRGPLKTNARGRFALD